MICPNCGREIPDGAVCPCALEAIKPPLSDNPAVNAIKTIGSSGLGLALTIFLSLSALLSIFSSVGVNQGLENLYYYAYMTGMDMDIIMDMMDASRSSSVVDAVLGCIPAILIAVAAWLHYSTCRSRASGNISTAGLTIWKVLTYIRLVVLCLASIVVLGGLAILIFLAATDSFPLDFLGSAFAASAGDAKLALIIIFATIAAFFAFFMALAIGYDASLIRTISRAKNVASTGYADDRVSGYVIGMNYVAAVFSILYGLFCLFFSPLTAVSAFVSAAGGILASLLLSRYRKAMNLVIFPPVMPPMPLPVQEGPLPEAPQEEASPADGQEPPQE